MDEVASVPVLAMSFFEECIAGFGLIWIIHIKVNSELVGAMSKLTLLSIGTEAFFSEIFAETAFDFGLSSF